MGEPIEEAYIPGDDCLAVWPAGETPEQMLFVVKDIQKCVWLDSTYVDPPEGTFTLNQHPTNPCEFLFTIFIEDPIDPRENQWIGFFVTFAIDPHAITIYSWKNSDPFLYLMFQGFFTGFEAEVENELACQLNVNGGWNGSVWVGGI